MIINSICISADIVQIDSGDDSEEDEVIVLEPDIPADKT